MEKEIGISGMSCANCAESVKTSIENVTNVESCDVNFATERAYLMYENELDWSDVSKEVNDAGYSIDSEEIEIDIEGMTCTNCAQTVKESVENVSGVLSADVNYATEQANISFIPDVTSRSEIFKAVEDSGYRPKSDASSSGDERTVLHSYKNRLILGTLFTFPLLLFMINKFFGLSMFGNEILGLGIPYIQLILATPIQIFLGYEFYKNSYNSIVRNRTANMDVLIALGSTTAYLYSAVVLAGFLSGGLYFDTAAFILLFITLGNYLEHRSKKQASSAIRELLSLEPETALVIRDGEEIEIPIRELGIGDVVKIKPGERIPSDGVVKNGKSSVDESMITGESLPVTKTEGDEVIGGTINKNGSLTVEITQVGENTALQQIVSLVKKAQSQQPEIQRFADRVSAYFVPVVIINAILWGLAWYVFPSIIAGFVGNIPYLSLVSGGPVVVGGPISVFEFSIVVFASSVLVACPCALGLATPAATMVGTSIGAKNGILFKSGKVLERMKDIDVVVFDKTGTLTKGELKVVDIYSNDIYDEDEVIRLFSSLEKNSEHHIASAITREAKDRGFELYDINNFNAIPGKGVEGNVKGEDMKVCNIDFVKSSNTTITPDMEEVVNKWQSKGYSVISGVKGGEIIGLIAISDEVRESSRETISKLKQRDVSVRVLTGDNESTANSIASELGIEGENVMAEVLPDEKSSQISRIQSSGKTVAMVGDGINDAPALAKADIGIAIGSGTDVAVETADITLIQSDPYDVVRALNISGATLSKIKQNLFWALGYNTAMIPLASLGFLQPVFAAIAMAVSSVSVLTNSLLFKRYRPDSEYQILGFLKD